MTNRKGKIEQEPVLRGCLFTAVDWKGLDAGEGRAFGRLLEGKRRKLGKLEVYQKAKQSITPDVEDCLAFLEL